MKLKIIGPLVFAILVAGCSLSPLDLINPAKPSLEVSAAVGQNVEQEKSNIKVESGKKEIRQKADTISNDQKYQADTIKQITQNVPIEYLLITVLLAGWAIPSPEQTFRGGKVVVSGIFQSLIVAPLRGFKEMFLGVFGKK